MNITTFAVAGHTIRLANDQRFGESECWKTSTDGGIWTPGVASLGTAIQAAINSVLYAERLHDDHVRGQHCDEVERLREASTLLKAALQDVVRGTGGALIVQDYGQLNQALRGDA